MYDPPALCNVNKRISFGIGKATKVAGECGIELL